MKIVTGFAESVVETEAEKENFNKTLFLTLSFPK
jgi:hypothetical protein